MKMAPKEWLAESISELELVGCIGDASADKVGECYYSSGPLNITVSLKQSKRTIVLREAKTGRQVATIIAIGGYPGPCPEKLDLLHSDNTIQGSSASFSDARDALSDYIEPH